MITYEVRSCTGGRERNEDSAAVKKCGEAFCFVLADGLGGHGKGEVASGKAVEAALKVFECSPQQNNLFETFEAAQKAVMEEQEKKNCRSQMKTTLAVLEIHSNYAKWGHVGDSRVYYFYKNRLVSRTLDHSVPQMLTLAGEIKEKEIRFHEDRNRLLRVIGVPWEKKCYDIAEPVAIKGRQAFLLCSDGWWELINEKEMVHCLKKADTAAEWLDLMEVIIQKNGTDKEMDNYSAIGVFLP